MKTKIIVGQSVQVFQIGQPEYWNKFGVEREYDSEVNELAVIDELVALMQKAHEKHSQTIVDFPFTKPVVKKETFADLKRELHVSLK